MAATTRRRIATVAPRTGFKPARGVPAPPGLVVTAPDGAPISHQASSPAPADVVRSLHASRELRSILVPGTRAAPQHVAGERRGHTFLDSAAMDPRYDPAGVETRWQETWEAEGLYAA